MQNVPAVITSLRFNSLIHSCLDMFVQASFAAYAALRTCKLPRIDAISGGLDASNNPIEDFELVPDMTEAFDLPIKNLPVCISLNR